MRDENKLKLTLLCNSVVSAIKSLTRKQHQLMYESITNFEVQKFKIECFKRVNKNTINQSAYQMFVGLINYSFAIRGNYFESYANFLKLIFVLLLI